MSFILVVLLIFLALGGVLGGVAYFVYRQKLRKAKAIERGLKMVPILIHLPSRSDDTEGGNRDVKDVMREKTAQAEVLYNLLAGTAVTGFRSTFYGQRHVALELIASEGLVHFYAAVPVALVSTVQKAIQTAYPGARTELAEDHNIFNQEGRLAATLGGEMVLRAESAYPIATYAKLERDPMEALLTSISALEKADGVAFQLMIRPATPNWIARSLRLVDLKRRGRHAGGLSPQSLLKGMVKAPEQQRQEHREKLGGQSELTNLQQSEIDSIEEKTKHPGFEVLIRVIVSTGSVARSQQLIRDIATTFALYDAPGLNGFTFLPAVDVQGLVTAFIFRFFPPELKGNVLNSVELATLFHLPDAQFTPSAAVERQLSKQVDGPTKLPTVGLLFGYNDFRGIKKEIRLAPDDRRRHTYILGQTGTGKSTMLENLAYQDMLAGNGFAFIDPHGDTAEKLLAVVPKNRAEDIIYFNPADTQYPLGLNLFEFNDPTQKDFLVQETINMLYKLYDPGHTGIIGPRYEHWYRNAALTLMSDPNGATFIEIPKVFTDTDYLKRKFKYLKDPTVIDFWTKEMGQTSDYHKSEMLGWFVSKFGAFQNNEMMRNIIGQTKSSFNIRDIMDQKKILIVNLSKGQVGELNSQLLGMIFVIKFQAAAMSRANVPEDQRTDFALYVDEFQNFSTDSFASILSEARKYRLNLIVANQFIGQLSNEIRDAVFGNIGTIVAHRMGPEDADFMVKQFQPVFDARDLMNLPNYNAAVRLMIGGLPSQPFTMLDSPPLSKPNMELGMAVRQLSAAKYGHDKASVESDIMARLAASPEPSVPSMGAVPAAQTPAPAASAVPVAPQPLDPVAAPVVATATSSLMPAPVSGAMPQVLATPSVGVVAAGQPEPVVAAPSASAPVPVSEVATSFVGAAGPVPRGAILPQPATPALPIEEGLPSIGQAPRTALDIARARVLDGNALPTVAVPQSAQDTVQPTVDLPGMVTTPPPIGAPPVDLAIQDENGRPVLDPSDQNSAIDVLEQPLPEPSLSVPRPSEAGMLSVMDITGGRPLPTTAPDPLVPADEGVPLPADVQTSPSDPYAGIDVLGDIAPPAAVRPAMAGAPLINAELTQVAGSVGAPMPDDPYAGIDVLSEPPQAPPASAAPALAASALAAPVPAAPVSVPSEAPGQSLPVQASVAMPEPVVPSMSATEPESQPAVIASMPSSEPATGPDSFIHFVDPAAEQVLASTTIPESVQPTAVTDEPASLEPATLPEADVSEAIEPELAVADALPVLPVALPDVPAPVVPEVQLPPLELKPALPLPADQPEPEAAVPVVADRPLVATLEPELPELKLRPARRLPEILQPAVSKPVVAPTPLVAAAPKPEPKFVPAPKLAEPPRPAPQPDVPPRPAPASQLAQAPQPTQPVQPPEVPTAVVESAAQMLQEAQVPTPLTKADIAPRIIQPSEPAQPEDDDITAENQVRQAQHEIDDLLSQSLIHLDTRKRLAEPVGPVDPEDGQELAASASRPEPQRVHLVQTPAARPAAGSAASEAVLAHDHEREAAARPKPRVIEPVRAIPVPGQPGIVKHGGGLLQQPAVSVTASDGTGEFGIPQAESLAVDDVARARAEREVEQKLHQSVPPVPVVPSVAADKPAQPNISHHRLKRQERAAEQVASPEEARHNRPTEAGSKAASLAGKLIMPSADKPETSAAIEKPVRPKKLAPGEIFVDENGNVVTGE